MGLHRYEKIMGGDYEVPGFVSAGGKDLIRRLLNTDPRRRLTAEQVYTSLSLYIYIYIYTDVLMGITHR